MLKILFGCSIAACVILGWLLKNTFRMYCMAVEDYHKINLSLENKVNGYAGLIMQSLELDANIEDSLIMDFSVYEDKHIIGMKATAEREEIEKRAISKLMAMNKIPTQEEIDKLVELTTAPTALGYGAVWYEEGIKAWRYMLF